MKINLMLGGVPPKFIDKSLEWIAVDSGLNSLMSANVIPISIIGDLDSVDKDFLQKYAGEIVKKNNQDMTDAEYALETLKTKYTELKEIDIYGATGKRQDHFLANLLLLNNISFEDILVRIIDDNNIIFIANEGRSVLSKLDTYKYISFIPLQSDTVITLVGTKYDVTDYTLTTDRANATSNEFSSEEIEVTTNNKCIVIYSKDK